MLKLNIYDYGVENEITDIILPHSIISEINTGGVFVKSFSDVNNGVVRYYGENGDLIDSFTYPCALGSLSTEIEYTSEFVRSLPMPSTMAYDHIRWRLWWTSDNVIYMMDVRNRQVVQQELGSNYNDTRGLNIELETGNAFVVVRKNDNSWRMLQIFRDNNYKICET